jgi:hypothetical protein
MPKVTIRNVTIKENIATNIPVSKNNPSSSNIPIAIRSIARDGIVFVRGSGIIIDRPHRSINA